MRTEHLSVGTLCVAVLGIAIAGCSDSEDNGNGTSDASGGTEASGGATSQQLGGANQTVTGGTLGTGGAPGSGGAVGKGGAPGSGGAVGNGGAPGIGGLGIGGLGIGGLGTGGLGTGGLGIGGLGTGGLGIGGAESGGSGIGGAETGGLATAGLDSGGSAGEQAGGNPGIGGGAAGEASGGHDESGGAANGGEPAAGGSIDDPGPCTESQTVKANARGSGPHEVVIETNTDDGINEGTIYRPADLGGDEKYPIFVWGEGACARDGLSNEVAMTEIASHGYFVVADGPVSGSAPSIGMTDDVVGMARPLLAYITWAITENNKPCSAYYHSLDTTKVAANGFSCGGLMAEGTAGDPRMTTWGITSSGLTGANQAFYATIHTPVLVILGGPDDVAYPNGGRDYDNISALGHPIMYFSKNIGHGGDLWDPGGGDFTRINLAWLNWWLKGDEGDTGKGVLVGSGCTYCTDNQWEVKSANLP